MQTIQPPRKSEDSRLRGFQGHQTHPVLPLERTFCSNCGKPHGWVGMDSDNNWMTDTGESVSPTEVVVICNECDERLGKLPLPEIQLKGA
jgi:hypothetical protein